MDYRENIEGTNGRNMKEILGKNRRKPTEENRRNIEEMRKNS